MDTSIDRIVLNDIQEHSWSDDEQLTNIDFGSMIISSSTDVDYSSREEQIIHQTSDAVIPQHRSISTHDCKYRIHLGTEPGSLTDREMTMEQRQYLHSQIIDHVDNLLIVSQIDYEIVRKDAFSNSAWGVEPYACFLLSCSYEMARGMASLIGLALRQDAIGIYSENNNDHSHPVLTIKTSDGSLMSTSTALHLMQSIIEDYNELVAQFDRNGQHIEFHDFKQCHNQQIPSDHIENIIKRTLGTNYSLHVTESSIQSQLLEKTDYDRAIREAGLEPLSKLIQLIRLHDILYHQYQSI